MGIVYTGINGEIVAKDLEVNAKEQEYVKYIIDHIKNVYNAFLYIFGNGKQYIPSEYNIETYEIALNKLKTDIAAHDKSKFSDEEFNAYRVKFFPTESEKKKIEEDVEYLNKVKEDFEKAWEHHYTNNDHHTKYWLIPAHDEVDEHLKDMSLSAIMHMICDWCAMSYHFDGDFAKVVDWYNNDADKEKSEMTEKTKSLVEELLKMIFNAEIK